jgi:hypothetical protein
MVNVTKTPTSTLSAPAGSYVVAEIGDDGCAAVLDDSLPPVALPSGTLLLVSPDHSLRLVWGSTCGWTAWCFDASLVRRAAGRAGLERLASLPVAPLIDDAGIRALKAALAFESRPASGRDARKWHLGRPRSRDEHGQHAA